MHTVIEPLCTGCELCIPVCPVDCILLVDATPGASGWAAWSEAQAEEARRRYADHTARTERDRRENDQRLAAKASAKLTDLQSASVTTDPAVLEHKRAVIEAAMRRARARPPT